MAITTGRRVRAPTGAGPTLLASMSGQVSVTEASHKPN